MKKTIIFLFPLLIAISLKAQVGIPAARTAAETALRLEGTQMTVPSPGDDNVKNYYLSGQDNGSPHCSLEIFKPSGSYIIKLYRYLDHGETIAYILSFGNTSVTDGTIDFVDAVNNYRMTAQYSAAGIEFSSGPIFLTSAPFEETHLGGEIQAQVAFRAQDYAMGKEIEYFEGKTPRYIMDEGIFILPLNVNNESLRITFSVDGSYQISCLGQPVSTGSWEQTGSVISLNDSTLGVKFNVGVIDADRLQAHTLPGFIFREEWPENLVRETASRK